MKQSERGSAAIEAAIATTVLFGIIAALAIAFYFSYTKYSITDIGYRTLVCSARSENLSKCKSKARETIKSRLPFGSVETLSLKKRGMGQSVLLRFRISKNLKVQYKKKFHYGAGR